MKECNENQPQSKLVEAEYLERIDYQGDLQPVLSDVANDFDIGEYKGFELITMGYEDLNLVLETDKGKYFVKILGSFRDQKECRRYAQVIEEALRAGVATPKLLESEQGCLYRVEEADINLLVTEFVDGNSFYELCEEPTDEESQEIVRQATLINSIDFQPTPLYDSWAVPNIEKEFEKTEKHLTDKDRQAIIPLLDAFRAIDLQTLPHALVHGDIIATNLMKSTNGRIEVIDFAVANYYPRLIELAVLMCNLLRNKDYDFVVSEYQKHIKLTRQELELLPLFVKLAHSMHIIGATREAAIQGNDSEENNHWLEQGRQGLAIS